MVEVQFFGIAIDSTMLFQIASATLATIGIIFAYLNYHKKVTTYSTLHTTYQECNFFILSINPEDFDNETAVKKISDCLTKNVPEATGRIRKEGKFELSEDKAKILNSLRDKVEQYSNASGKIVKDANILRALSKNAYYSGKPADLLKYISEAFFVDRELNDTRGKTIDLNMIERRYFKLIISFLYRYEYMLTNHHHDYTYEQIRSVYNEKLIILAKAYFSNNPESIYDALSEMTNSVMEISHAQQYYSRGQFINDILNISRLLRDGKYIESRIILYNISNERNIDCDIMFITFFLRNWSGALMRYKSDDEIEKKENLTLIFAKGIDTIAKFIKNNDKISTLKSLDNLLRYMIIVNRITFHNKIYLLKTF